MANIHLLDLIYTPSVEQRNNSTLLVGIGTKATYQCIQNINNMKLSLKYKISLFHLSSLLDCGSSDTLQHV